MKKLANHVIYLNVVEFNSFATISALVQELCGWYCNLIGQLQIQSFGSANMGGSRPVQKPLSIYLRHIF